MIVPVIFSSVLGILFILYVIGYTKKVVSLQRMSLPVMLPCSAGIAVPFLFLKMPDSLHIMLFSSIAVFFVSLAVLLEPLSLKRKQIVENVLFFLSNALWIYIFYSIFYIYDFYVAFAVIMDIFYLGIVIFFCIKLEIKSVKKIFRLFVMMIPSFALNFISISTVWYTRSVYSILLFLGTSFLIAFDFTALSTRFKSAIKNSKIILTLLFMFGELCIYAASVLMLMI